MAITRTAYPQQDLVVCTCTGIFDFRECLSVSRDDLTTQATCRVNAIRHVDFRRVTPELLKAVVLASEQQVRPVSHDRGRTAFIITEEVQHFDWFNALMRWVHTLARHRDFALFFALTKAFEWFWLEPASAQHTPRRASSA